MCVFFAGGIYIRADKPKPDLRCDCTRGRAVYPDSGGFRFHGASHSRCELSFGMPCMHGHACVYHRHACVLIASVPWNFYNKSMTHDELLHRVFVSERRARCQCHGRTNGQGRWPMIRKILVLVCEGTSLMKPNWAHKSGPIWCAQGWCRSMLFLHHRILHT